MEHENKKAIKIKWYLMLLLITILVASIFYYKVLWNNLVLVMNIVSKYWHGITAITLVIITLIQFLKYLKDNKVNVVIVIGYIFVLGLALKSDYGWCYFAVIVLIAYNFGLINKNLEIFIKECFSGKKEQPMTNKEKEDKKRETEICFSDKARKGKVTPMKKVEWQPYLREGIIGPNIEKRAVNYFCRELNIPFDSEMKITAKGVPPIYPDAIKTYPNIDCLLEVKFFSSNVCNCMYEHIKKYVNFYKTNYPKQNLCIYIVIITNDEISADEILKIQSKMDNTLATLNNSNDILYLFKTYVIKTKDLN